MGRGERSKKKRRFRSLSPAGRSGTPGGRYTPDVGGGGGYGGGGTLTEIERTTWRCAHCRIWGTGVWAVRDGPYGPRVRADADRCMRTLPTNIFHSLSATIAASCSSATESFLDGPRTCISATCGKCNPRRRYQKQFESTKVPRYLRRFCSIFFPWRSAMKFPGVSGFRPMLWKGTGA